MDTPTFDSSVYDKVQEITRKSMSVVEEGMPRLKGTIEKMNQNFVLDETLDGADLHNQYIDAIFCAFLLKLYNLNSSIIYSVNRNDFLTYALVSRSLLENAATVKWYMEKKFSPLFSTLANPQTNAESRGNLFKELIDQEDRLLKAGRFDWESYFTNNLQKLNSDYAQKLENKKKKKKTYKTDPMVRQQVNALTCIEEWGGKNPNFGVLYDLFCDMVHPNIGSTMCLAVPNEGGISFTIDQEKSTGMRFFDQTFSLLRKLVSEGLVDNLAGLLQMKLSSDHNQLH